MATPIRKRGNHGIRKAFRIGLAGIMVFLAVFAISIPGMQAGRADGYGETVLKVYSQGSGAYIDLYTDPGRCRMENRTAGGLSPQQRSESCPGFFYLYISHGGAQNMIPWAPAATINWDRASTEERIRIRLDEPGEYTIYVEPMAAEDINTYWIQDRFLYWESPAAWHVADSYRCSDGSRQYDHGTVTVYCYADGGYMDSYQVTIRESQTVYPKQIDGYTSESSAWVTFDRTTGQCSPAAVSFFYTGIAPQPGSGWNAGDYRYLQSLPGSGCAAYVTNPSLEYIKPQCGPGDQYQTFRAMDGKKHLYDPQKIAYANICFTVGDWDYVEYKYVDKIMYGFFRKGVFTPVNGRDQIPQYALTGECGGTINQETSPHNAPSYSSGEYVSCSLRRGDTVYACLQSNGWYFCRFWNDHDNNYGNVYLWVPGTAINFW